MSIHGRMLAWLGGLVVGLTVGLQGGAEDHPTEEPPGPELLGAQQLVQGNGPNLPLHIPGWQLIPGDQALVPEWIIEGPAGAEWNLKLGAEYRGPDPLQQRALLTLTAFRSSEEAENALQRLVEGLEGAYHSEVVKAMAVEALSWRRPQPQAGKGGPYHLVWAKPPGQRDEHPAGLLWRFHNILLNMRFEGLKEEKEAEPFTADLLEALTELGAGKEESRKSEITKIR